MQTTNEKVPLKKTHVSRIDKKGLKQVVAWNAMHFYILTSLLLSYTSEWSMDVEMPCFWSHRFFIPFLATLLALFLKNNFSFSYSCQKVYPWITQSWYKIIRYIYQQWGNCAYPLARSTIQRSTERQSKPIGDIPSGPLDSILMSMCCTYYTYYATLLW